MRRFVIAALALVACSDVTTNLASDPQRLGTEAGTRALDAAARGDASPTRDAAGSLDASAPALCGDHVCACDDGIDDDGDGKIDGFDPECTGPSDDDESSFATGAPENNGRCRGCFWDTNAGLGKDDCRYPEECLTGVTPPTKGVCTSCDVSTRCVDSCQQRTPNGCDCFGCCQITRDDGTTVQVELNDACSLAKLDDTTACPRCQLSATCQNPCGHCELCPGRTPDKLPADCMNATSTAPRYVCDEGQAVCSPTTACAAGAYCQLGCCLYEIY